MTNQRSSPGSPTSYRVAGILPATADLYRSSGFAPPWIGYVAVSEGRAVGTCAFKCAPVEGRVEIAYFTFPEFEGRGLATAMDAIRDRPASSEALKVSMARSHALREPGAARLRLKSYRI